MKRSRARLALIAALGLVAPLLCAATSGEAVGHRSGFGFEISVPDTWLVLTRGAVSERSDLILGESDPQNPNVLDVIPEDARRAVLERIERGDLEIFYRRGAVANEFIDNINVMRQSTTFPATPEQVQAICRVLPVEFSRIFGRPIAMDHCEARDMVGRRALYFQFDGAVEGTKSLQYQIERASGDTLVLTATVANARLPQMLGEFEAIVSSIRFDE